MITRLAERIGQAADAVVGLPAPYPAAYADTWVSLLRARAVITAARLGVFDALPGTTAELARRCGADEERLRVLLDALRELRYVRRSRTGSWRAARRARQHLTPGARLPLRCVAADLSAASWDVMGGLDDVLRGAAPPGLHDGGAGAEVFAGYQAAMTELVELVLPVVLAAIGTPRRLLDLGGGPGTLAIRAAERDPQLTAVVAELPDAAALGRERVAAAGLSDRIDYVEGDARTSPLPGGFDVATLVSLLHNVDRATSVELLRRAGELSRRVVVMEIEAGRTQIGALASLAFTGWMGSRTWSGDELAAMAREAGLTEVRVTRPRRLPGNVVVEARGLR